MDTNSFALVRIQWDTVHMIEVRTTDEFDAWIGRLKDQRAAHAVTSRLIRLGYGLLGDVRPVGEGVSEARIHYGPGLRVYFVRRGQELIIVLGGGDKSTQSRDIERAIALAAAI
jgi:putative addiction module killer protein